ncbi:MAG TPA: hypothetical protein VLN26_15990 [Gaiellaceae bacterium]|nr:hypothetical protein [Gaiellaceae bacterium]
MSRYPALAAGLAAAALVPAASAAPQRSIPLKVGDAIDVVGTRIACFALRSNGKNGMACVLLEGSDPIVGSYGAGLAVDGTAVLNKIKADGTSADVFRRKLQAARTVYKVKTGDLFGLKITNTVSLRCRVIDVTATNLEAVYRGVKVSCWRATATRPLPNTYGISISDRFAGVFRFDAKGNVTSWGVMRRQPQ